MYTMSTEVSLKNSVVYVYREENSTTLHAFGTTWLIIRVVKTRRTVHDKVENEDSEDAPKIRNYLNRFDI